MAYAKQQLIDVHVRHRNRLIHPPINRFLNGYHWQSDKVKNKKKINHLKNAKIYSTLFHQPSTDNGNVFIFYFLLNEKAISWQKENHYVFHFCLAIVLISRIYCIHRKIYLHIFSSRTQFALILNAGIMFILTSDA